MRRLKKGNDISGRLPAVPDEPCSVHLAATVVPNCTDNSLSSKNWSDWATIPWVHCQPVRVRLRHITKMLLRPLCTWLRFPPLRLERPRLVSAYVQCGFHPSSATPIPVNASSPSGEVNLSTALWVLLATDRTRHFQAGVQFFSRTNRIHRVVFSPLIRLILR